MSTDVKASKKRPSVRESMEVKRGTQGLGRMLRRGLHGVKNWVLEPDEHGVHRTVGSKAFRAAVALAPGWIVASAFTGSPESGGEQMGVFQAFFMALLVTACMLAFFSARERRMGREEPWTEEAPNEMETSQDKEEFASEQGLPQVPEQASPADGENVEKPAEVPKNPQVREVTTEVTTAPSGHNGYEKDHFELSEPPMVTPAVTEAVTQVLPTVAQNEVFDQVSDQVTTSDDAVTPMVSQVVTPLEKEIEYDPIENFLEEESPTVRLGGGHFEEKAVTDVPEERVNPQVNGGDHVVTPGLDGAPRISLEKTPKVKSTGSEPSIVTQPVTQPVTKGTQEPLFSQVKKVEKLVTQPVTSVVIAPSMATVGPYESTEDPLTDSWWSVAPDAPDVDSSRASEEPVEVAVEVETKLVEPESEKEISTLRETLQESPEEVVESPEEVVVEAASQVEMAGIDIPQEVMLFLATRHSKDVPREAKERARQGAVAWVRRGAEENGLTQRQAASILGVSKTTIANWLSDDPWTIQEEDETQ